MFMDTYRGKIVGLKQKLIPTRSYLVVKSVLSELPTNHIDTMMILCAWKEIKSRIVCQTKCGTITVRYKTSEKKPCSGE